MMPLLQSRIYTYKDYLGWPEDKRIELVDGVPILQATPTPEHQIILAELTTQFVVQLRGKECKVYPSPFTVKLSEVNVFEPDLSIICNKDLLDKNGYHGAPELIIEIISPSSIKHDRYTKFYHYENAGVKEYWIVEPEGKLVNVFVLNNSNDRFQIQGVYCETEKIRVNVLPDLSIDLSLVFAG